MHDAIIERLCSTQPPQFPQPSLLACAKCNSSEQGMLTLWKAHFVFWLLKCLECCRPISKMKAWRLTEILRREPQYDAAAAVEAARRQTDQRRLQQPAMGLAASSAYAADAT